MDTHDEDLLLDDTDTDQDTPTDEAPAEDSDDDFRLPAPRAGSGSLAARDPLHIYLSEISKFPMIQTALEKEPDNPFFLDSLAWVYFRLHRTQDALTAIHKAIGHKVKDAIIWEHYGDIAVAAGRRDEAKQAYGKALELGSETPEAVAKKLEALR